MSMKTIFAAALLAGAAIGGSADGVRRRPRPRPATRSCRSPSSASARSWRSREFRPTAPRSSSRCRARGKGFLGIIDLDKPGSAPDFFLATSEFRELGDRDVIGWRWVGNEDVVVTMRSREDVYGQRADIWRLAAYNLKTKKLTPLAWDGATGDASDILHIDHDKGKILLARMSNAYGTEMWQRYEVVLGRRPHRQVRGRPAAQPGGRPMDRRRQRRDPRRASAATRIAASSG